MRVLVAGGTRFIGRHLVEFLLDEGHEVTLFNRGQTNPHLFPGVARVRGNRLAPPAELGQSIWDWVFDLSAYTEAQLTPLVQLVGPRSGRYIYLSTRATYMTPPEGVVEGLSEGAELTEDSPQWPPEERYLADAVPSWYGARKAKAEAALWRLGAALGMPVSVVRPPVVYGPWDEDRRCLYWLQRVQAGEVVIPGPPAAFTHCIYVKDGVRVLIAVAKARHAAGRAYNAAMTRYRSLQEWIDTAAAVLGRAPRVKTVSWDRLDAAGVERLPDVKREGERGFSTQRVQRELGFTSSPFAQTLAECFAYMATMEPPVGEAIPLGTLASLMR